MTPLWKLRGSSLTKFSDSWAWEKHYLYKMLSSGSRDEGTLAGTSQHIIYGVTSTSCPSCPSDGVNTPITHIAKDNTSLQLLQTISHTGILILDPLSFDQCHSWWVDTFYPLLIRLLPPAKGQGRQPVGHGCPQILCSPSVATSGLLISTGRAVQHQESSPGRKLIKTCDAQ